MTGKIVRLMSVWTTSERNPLARTMRLAITCFTAGCLTATLSLTSADAQQRLRQEAQTLNSIEVLVNDQPISTYDINQRLYFVVALSGGVKSQDELTKVREEVIRNMIDERLKIQEAQEFEATLSAEELDEYFIRRAQSVGQTPDQFSATLEQIGSSKQAVVDQLHAEVVWGRIVQGLFSNRAAVTDEEIQTYIERQKANKGEAEYRIAEIVLPVRSADADATVKRSAEALVDRLRGGASFPDLAQQLSSAATAASGGDMGWIALPDMPEERADALRDLDIGGISDPIRTAGSYIILSVRDRRRVMEADELDTQFILAQYLLPITPDTGEEVIANYRKNAAELQKTGATCNDELGAKLIAMGGDERVFRRPTPARAMSAAMRNLVMPLKQGDVSDILDAQYALISLIVCERVVPDIRELQFDDVQNQLEQQRLSMASRRYLRDIRREAIIDYR